MILKGLSTVIALLCVSTVLIWTLSYSSSMDTPKVIGKVRSYSVLDLTWARLENWRKDQKKAPCEWVSTQAIPVFGGFEVDCMIDGELWARFDVSADMSTIKPADKNTTHRLEALAEWARVKKRYP